MNKWKISDKRVKWKNHWKKEDLMIWQSSGLAWCRQERKALAISVARSQLSHGRPCSEGWMSALWKRNVIPVLSGRKSWRDGSREKQEKKVRNIGREGKKIDFERHHKMMWHRLVPVRQNHLHPSSLLQNNGRIYHTLPIHRKDFSNREATWK